MSESATILSLASKLRPHNCAELPFRADMPDDTDRRSSRSTSSTVVPGEQAPLLDSASEHTLRGDARAREYGATAPMGLPLANGLLGRVAALYKRAVRSNDERRRGGDEEAPRVGDVGVTDVSRCRGSFICLAVWVLLFLQGETLPPRTQL